MIRRANTCAWIGSLAVEKMNPAMTMKRGIMAKCKLLFAEARREHELTEILDAMTAPGR